MDLEKVNNDDLILKEKLPVAYQVTLSFIWAINITVTRRTARRGIIKSVLFTSVTQLAGHIRMTVTRTSHIVTFVIHCTNIRTIAGWKLDQRRDFREFTKMTHCLVYWVRVGLGWFQKSLTTFFFNQGSVKSQKRLAQESFFFCAKNWWSGVCFLFLMAVASSSAVRICACSVSPFNLDPLHSVRYTTLKYSVSLSQAYCFPMTSQIPFICRGPGPGRGFLKDHSLFIPPPRPPPLMMGGGGRFSGSHGFQGGTEGDLSSPTDLKGVTIENWLPINCHWGDHTITTEPRGVIRSISSSHTQNPPSFLRR